MGVELKPTLSALMVTAARAAHLIVDQEPVIFRDTMAQQLLGADAEPMLRYHRDNPDSALLASVRAQTTCRSRYAEDRLAQCVAADLDQYVILGAGLDTYAYRSPGRVRVFEVDRPGTQEWKRQRLAAVGIGEPATLTWVPMDFERDALAECLVAAGFDPTRPAVVSWLGVSMYLTRAAIHDVLSTLGSFPRGSELIMDYIVPPELRDEGAASYAETTNAAASAGGEPYLTAMTPRGVAESLAECGLEVIEDVDQETMINGIMVDRNDALRPSGLLRLVAARPRPDLPRA